MLPATTVNPRPMENHWVRAYRGIAAEVEACNIDTSPSDTSSDGPAYAEGDDGPSQKG